MLVSLLLLLLAAGATYSLTIEEDGGYTDLVIELEDGVNTENCTKTVSCEKCLSEAQNKS